MPRSPGPGSWRSLVVEVDAPSATITIRRPQVLNALDHDTLEELSRALLALEAHAEVRGIIITGAGEKAFVAGADIRELQGLDGQQGLALSRFGQEVLRLLDHGSKPTIAAINGLALGGGCELALACDLRLASEHATLGLPEVGLGLIPGFGGTQRLPRLVGPARALELLLTGSSIHADEACRIGLVNRVVPHAELLSRARELVERMARNAPQAVAAARQAVRQGLDVDLARGLDIESLHFGILCSTEDKREGLTAFLEKRSPRFGGH